MLIVSLRSTTVDSSCHFEEDGLLAESELRRGGELDLGGAGGPEFGFESIECWDGDALEVVRLMGYDVRLQAESMDCCARGVAPIESSSAVF